MRYEVVELENGTFGVRDTQAEGFQMVAFGMTKERAIAWADRLNLREAWGI